MQREEFTDFILRSRNTEKFQPYKEELDCFLENPLGFLIGETFLMLKEENDYNRRIELIKLIEHLLNY